MTPTRTANRSAAQRRLRGTTARSGFRRCLGLAAIVGALFFIRIDLRGSDPPAGRYPGLGTFSLSSALRQPLPAGRARTSGRLDRAPSEAGAEAPSGKKLGRAVLEYFAIVAVPQVIYWATHRNALKPWHYRLTWEDQSKRFFSLQTWSFDSNCFFLNWTHGPVGALYYNIARSNRLSRLESLLFTLGGSFYWEYIAEWASALSINDQILTVLGGLPIGETWHVLGEYFISRSGLVNNLLGFLNPALKFNRWLDRKAVRGVPPEPGWHDFRLSFGCWINPGRDRELSALNMSAGVDAQLLNLPDAEKPGDLWRTVGATMFSQASFDLITARGRVDEIGFFFRSVYGGTFRKNIGPDLNGFRFYAGLGSAFSFFKQRSVAFYDSSRVVVKDIDLLKLDEPRHFRDKYSAVHLLGPAFDLTVRRGALRARVMVDAYLDFSVVNALALNSYSRIRDISVAKTTLVYYGYYYALGGSLFLRLDIEYGPVEVRGFFRGHAWGSIEGLDHFQAEVKDDFHLTDGRTFMGLRAGYRFGTFPLVLTVAVERIGRNGSLKDVSEKEREVRLSAGLLFRF